MAEMTNGDVLLSPFYLRELSLKNRVVMAPMTRSRAGKERMPNYLMAEYYAQRASAGLIVTEATAISKQAIGWLNTPGIYSDEQTEAWKEIVDSAPRISRSDLNRQVICFTRHAL
jgi:N-ethylmaleimide reductase